MSAQALPRCPVSGGWIRGALTPALSQREREIRKSQQRIAAFNVVQRLQYRVLFKLVTVGQAPLQLTNPHRDARQLGGIFVQLNAQHVVRASDQVGFAVQPHGLGG